MKKNNLKKYLLIVLAIIVALFGIYLIAIDGKDSNKQDLGKLIKDSDAQAQFELGCKYYTGIGAKLNYEKAREYFEVAASKGSVEAQRYLELLYRSKNFGETNEPQKDLEVCKKTAQMGDQIGQFLLAHFYDNGIGVKKDVARAIELYKKSAAQGYYRAQSQLGYCYEFGIGLEKDIQKAIELYKKSAAQGSPRAEYYLANCYFNGKGVTRDYKRAAKLYISSAVKNNVYSGMKLINCYYNGIGVKKDYKKCAFWLKHFYGYYVQQEKNAKDVIYDIATRYESGDGLERDYTEAFAWYFKAHKLGHAHAIYCVGKFFENGIVVNKNLDMAIKKYKLAADCGDKDAKEALRRLNVNNTSGN
ncbi:MAG: SEL1-like repeat protein [Synergistaceae bacterium]|nr:SEL1-like repeat protein [Synergistaceae bacterium]